MEIQIKPFVDTPPLALDDPAPGPAGVDAEDTARFSKLMGGADAPADPESVGAVSHGPHKAEAADHDRGGKGASDDAPRSLGDKILGGLQNVSSDLERTKHALHESMKAKNLTVPQMMSMQMAMVEMS